MAYVLYHGDCYDGFGAAWATKKGMEHRPEKDQDVYIPCIYGQPMPEIPDGEEVIIVDFSFPEAQLRALAARSFFVTILDHHKTAQADLQGLLDGKDLPENMSLTFDMNHSGAYLAWADVSCDGSKFPTLLAYIEDRDLWRKKLPYTNEVNVFIQSWERTFENFDMLDFILQTDSGLDDALEQGRAILRFKDQKVNEIAAQAVRLKVGEYENIPAVNCTYNFGSDVANRLLELHADAPLAAYWLYRKDGQWQWGLRSRQGSDIDVSVIAKSYGGGGHKHAAGFEGDVCGS